MQYMILLATSLSKDKDHNILIFIAKILPLEKRGTTGFHDASA